jgi:hypothetical protein
MSRGEKAPRKQIRKNGDISTMSSPTFFNSICDNGEMIFMKNA